jgi:hypothetical protein
MTPNAEGVLEGVITVTAEGFYTIDLTTADSATVTGSPRVPDRRDRRSRAGRESDPKPGHDIRPTTIEEVFVEAIGGGRLRRRAARAGLLGERRRGAVRRAARTTARALTEASAGHTFYLEELDLRAGRPCVVLRSRDGQQRRERENATSDMFFMNIRPFGRDYRQAEQAGGGGAVASRAGRESGRAVAAAARDHHGHVQPDTGQRELLSDREFAEHLNTITLMQDRLREQVTTLRHAHAEPAGHAGLDVRADRRDPAARRGARWARRSTRCA